MWRDAELRHGKHTVDAANETLEHLLKSGDNLRQDQKDDIGYVLEMLVALKKSAQTPDEDARKNIRNSDIDESTQAYLLSFSASTRNDVPVRRKVKAVVDAIRFEVRMRKATGRRQDRATVISEVRNSADAPGRAELDKLDSWSGFDVFHLGEMTGGHPLKHVGFEALQKRRLLETFNCRSQKTCAFLAKLEELYVKFKNPYHNNLHGADVAQCVHAMFCHTTFLQRFPELDIFSGILAALGHDIAHPAVTNEFRVKAGDDLALTYNDISVNENMHCAEFFRILKDDENDFLDGLSTLQRTAVRKDIICSILGTDMANHFCNYKKFEDLIMLHGTDLQKWEDIQPVLQAIVHTADISNCTRPMNIALKWTDRVLEEFFAQGDRERAASKPISPLCDRETTSKPTSQVGFIKFIVAPTFNSLWKLDSELEEPINNLDAYKCHWEQELAKRESKEDGKQ